jgi:RNA polymerase sigma-70 factor, ECF subfamily
MNTEPPPLVDPPSAEPAMPDPDVSIDTRVLARGDRDATEALYRELFEPVYAFVFWRVGGIRQDAEDVTQETFLTAIATIQRFEGRSSLYAWVCGIAKNLAHTRLRGRSRRERDTQAVDGATGVEAAPDRHLERAQTEHLVGLALTELPPHYQRALLDKYVQHQSFAEMAVAQGCSAKAVESIVQRAKRALAAACERRGIGPLDRVGESHE